MTSAHTSSCAAAWIGWPVTATHDRQRDGGGRRPSLHRIEVRDQRGRLVTASVELRYRRITVLPPIGKQKRYPPLSLTVLSAREPETPKDRPAIDWRLITDLPVDTPSRPSRSLDWYARRWKIEVFHHILKTGCRAEHARLRTAERLVKLIAVYCILAWRVFWTTMIRSLGAESRPAPRRDRPRDCAA